MIFLPKSAAYIGYILFILSTISLLFSTVKGDNITTTANTTTTTHRTTYEVQICNDRKANCLNEDVKDLSISSLNELCRSYPSYPSNILNLTRFQIKNMHFDFCNKIALSIFSNGTSNFSTWVNCTLLDVLHIADKQSERYFNDYRCILNRADDCSIVKDKTECKECKESYKEWLCIRELPFSVNGQTLSMCPSVPARVCLQCPALAPENGYGGYSSFICTDDGGIDGDDAEYDDTECSKQPCASIKCLSALYHPVLSNNDANNATCT